MVTHFANELFAFILWINGSLALLENAVRSFVRYVTLVTTNSRLLYNIHNIIILYTEVETSSKVYNYIASKKATLLSYCSHKC